MFVKYRSSDNISYNIKVNGTNMEKHKMKEYKYAFILINFFIKMSTHLT